MSSNRQIARLFDAIADLLELSGANPFRIRAYRRASQAIDGLAGDLSGRAEDGSLEEIPGIGKDLASKIQEFLENGTMAEYEGLRAEVPGVLLQMIQIPGLGPKNAIRLREELGVEDLEGLEAACRSGAVARLTGFGKKSQENILEGIAFVRRARERRPLGEALETAQEFLDLLEGTEGVSEASLAGSLRRMRETVGDVDLIAASEDPGPVMEAFTHHRWVARILARGTTKSSIRTRDDLQVDLRVVSPEVYGAALLHFTGSKEHNVRLRELALRKNLKVSEWGIFDVSGLSDEEREERGTGQLIESVSEAACYGVLGLPWIPPELREDTGEIQAATEGALPDLLELKHIRGDLHAHTDWSDGKQTLEDLIQAARDHGYAYVGVTDHSRSLKIAGGLDLERMKRQIERVREADSRTPGIAVLVGTEVDILKDGRLDYPDTLLEQLDVVIASVHTHFNLSRDQQTERICRAMESPYVFAVGHPTGRLLGERDPYEVDMASLIVKAAETGTALEINANPRRLDLNDQHVRQAVEAGVEIVIGTDAHRVGHFDFMEFGVKVARRAWMGADGPLNTLPLGRMKARLRQKR